MTSESKVLLISGSPRKGNTDFVLATIFNKIIKEKELILLREKNIKHCIGCLSCHNKPECVIRDDMTEIRDKMIRADILVVGTPNYFDNVSGLLKDFIDRTHPFYKAESLRGKKLILVMVGGGKIEGSHEYLKHSTEGFMKYLKLDLVNLYCFQALDQNDIKQNSKDLPRIESIIDEINAL